MSDMEAALGGIDPLNVAFIFFGKSKQQKIMPADFFWEICPNPIDKQRISDYIIPSLTPKF